MTNPPTLLYHSGIMVDYKTMTKELDEAINDIMRSIMINREVISKQLLLSLIAKHDEIYNRGLLPYNNWKLLNNAVLEIWKRQYHTDPEILRSN